MSEFLIPNIIGRVTPDGMVEISDEFQRLLDDFYNGGADSSTTTVGSILSGVTAAQETADTANETASDAQTKSNNIISGTQPLDDVIINNRGSLIAEQDMQNSELGGAKTDDITVEFDRSSVSQITNPGQEATTGDVTATASGGVGPYSYSWAKLSGDDIVANSPSADTTTFTGTPQAQTLRAIFEVTATDSSTPTALTGSRQISVTIHPFTFTA